MPFKFSNFATATLTSAISSSDVSITVATGLGALFPALNAGERFMATLVDSSNNLEIVAVTARAGDVMTVIRAQEGTSSRAYPSGSRFELRVTASALSNFVQLDGNQTIGGTKTFSSPIVGSLNGNAATVTDGVYTVGDQTISGVKIFAAPRTKVSNSSFAMYELEIPGVHARGWYLDVNGNVRLSTTTGAGSASTQLVLVDTPGNMTVTGNINSNGAITAAGDVTAFSDERVKTNWRDVASDFVDRLAEVRHGIFDRTDISKTQVGVGAQSLRSLIPEAVWEDAEGRLSVSYGNAALLACVKLAQRVVAVEAKLEAKQ